jgi:hypothetical protein
MKIIKAIILILIIFSSTSTVYSAESTELLSKVDSYRVCDFRSYTFSSIWDKVCWEFPVMGAKDIKGEFIAIGDYLINKEYVSELKKNFPLDTFVNLIAKYDPKKEFPKWRMPPKINVIVVLYDKKSNYLGSIQIDSNYDAFSIISEKSYYFRFGNGAGDNNVSILIETLLK